MALHQLGRGGSDIDDLRMCLNFLVLLVMALLLLRSARVQGAEVQQY